jgi:stage V sporulation protein B
MIIAAAVKVSLNWRLAALPQFGILGAGWATIADISLAALINMFFIWRATGYFLEVGRLLRAIVATAVMAAVMAAILQTGEHIGAGRLFLATAAGAATYLPGALLFGVLPAKDLSQLPGFGEFYEKCRKRRRGR